MYIVQYLWRYIIYLIITIFFYQNDFHGLKEITPFLQFNLHYIRSTFVNPSDLMRSFLLGYRRWRRLYTVLLGIWAGLLSSTSLLSDIIHAFLKNIHNKLTFKYIEKKVFPIVSLNWDEVLGCMNWGCALFMLKSIVILSDGMLTYVLKIFSWQSIDDQECFLILLIL